MSLLSSDKSSSASAQPEIPAGFLEVVRTMQDDIDGKPAKRAGAVAHAENAAANPFSPDFKPGDAPKEKEETAPEKPFTGPFGTTAPTSVPEVTPGGIALEKPEKQSSEKMRKIMIGGGLALAALAVLSVFAYFLLFWSRQPATEPVAEAPTTEVPETSATETPAETTETPVIPPFSADQPNYLPIDVETATAESVRQILNEAGAKIVEAKMAGPVEFLVTDKNNNPLAFSRFAFVTGLGLSSDLVALIEEPFSVFVYADMGAIRYGIVVSFKDPVMAAERLTKEEAKLPTELKPLLYGKAQTVATSAAFRSGSYADTPVRFVNVDAEQNLSLDYMVRGKQWLIGSSKDTLRAIVDRMK